MKVKDLVAKLQQFPPDADISIRGQGSMGESFLHDNMVVRTITDQEMSDRDYCWDDERAHPGMLYVGIR